MRGGLAVNPNARGLATPDAAPPATASRPEGTPAEAAFRGVLECHPGQPDVLHLLGLAALEQGRVADALELIGRARERASDVADYHTSFGLALLDAGRTAEAAQAFAQAAALDRDSIRPLLNLAHAQERLGELPQALATYALALERAPNDAGLHAGIGGALARLERTNEALRHLARAVELDGNLLAAWLVLGALHERREEAQAAHDAYQRARELARHDPLILCALGRVCAALGRLEEAAEWYGRALMLDPGLADARLGLAAVLHAGAPESAAHARLSSALNAPPAGDTAGRTGERKDLRADAGPEAERSLHRLLLLEPDNLELGLELGRHLRRRGQADDALAHYQSLIARHPHSARAESALALVLIGANRREEALAHIDHALALEPKSPVALNNLGSLRQELGQFDAALEAYEQALALAPEYAEAHYNRAQLLLRLGRYAEGWREYDWRLGLPASRALPRLPADWDALRPVGRRVAVVGEQGPGDVVLFAHCLSDLIADAHEVSLHVERRLVPLFRRSFPGLEVSDRRPRRAAGQEGAPLVLPIGSLPRIYRNSEADFARARARYLTPDPERVEHWRARLAALGPGPKIGLSWRGGKSPTERRLRDTALADWDPLFAVSEARFVNLQYDARRGEIEQARRRRNAKLDTWDDLELMHDLDELVALIEALDLVVSMANTTVHFAGALNKPVWILVPAAPSWRWQHQRADSPWYRSARLLRQTMGEPWSRFAERVAAELARHLHNVSQRSDPRSAVS
ncbi:MAG TPA: tetratricopeptide repeat protein [Alphaproteobacteria bacterium]|nr:tetratricopeptide repeat protein [Alphaproteobacteria bacterium]